MINSSEYNVRIHRCKHVWLLGFAFFLQGIFHTVNERYSYAQTDTYIQIIAPFAL